MPVASVKSPLDATSPKPDGSCPVSVGVRLIGERWCLLIVRELLTGSSRFNDIHRGLPGLSRTLLSSRLQTLIRHGLVERASLGPTRDARQGYVLTPAGEGLRHVIEAIGGWAVDWKMQHPAEAEADVSTLIWRLFQAVDRAALPEGRVSLEFRFPGSVPSRGWIKVDARGSAACVGAPEHDVNLVVTTTPQVLNELSTGLRTCTSAKASGDIAFQGPASLARDFGTWFRTSPFKHRIGARFDVS